MNCEDKKSQRTLRSSVAQDAQPKKVEMIQLLDPLSTTCGASKSPSKDTSLRNANRDWFLPGTVGAVDLSSICYVDLHLLRSIVVGRVDKRFLELVPPVKSLDQLLWDDHRFLYWCVDLLAKASLIVAPVAIKCLDHPDELQGDLLSVCHKFRTQNVGCWRTNDLRVGKIYRRAGGMSLDLVVDPRWVVPGHGHSQLAAGHAAFGGIFLVEAISKDARAIIGRPVILGDPVSLCWAAITGNNGFHVCTTPEVT